MPFDLNSWLSIAKEINADNYSYSNEILYSATNGISILPPAKNATEAQLDKLASVMLLIGRTYAASPERRKGAKSINDGMITFFAALAQKMIQSENYAEWRKTVVELSEAHYAFDGCEEDYRLLQSAHHCVFMLDTIIREFIKTIDEKESLDDVDHCLSFCSKLLHFIVPQIFFIKDGISWESIWSIYRRRADATIAYKHTSLKIPKYVFGEYLNKTYPLFTVTKKEKADTNEQQYWFHYRGCYALSCTLKDVRLISQTKNFNGIADIHSLPRLVDTILLHIKA